MGKKRNLSNENIVELIERIIGYESMDTRNNCPRPHSYGKFDCSIGDNCKKVSCGEFKEIYLEQLREDMIKKYVVLWLKTWFY